ncbi:MAG: PhnB protein [Chlamydiales bacterium]|jgi:PhnB protein
MFPLPKGFSTLMPILMLPEAEKTIQLYEIVFDAKVHEMAIDEKTNKVLNCRIAINESSFFISDIFPEGGRGTEKQFLYLYVNDVDALFKKSQEFGFKALSQPIDMFYGDRIATIEDLHGNIWKIAQKKKEITLREAINAKEQDNSEKESK